MKRALLVPLIVIAFVTMSCGLFARDVTPEAPVVVEEATQEKPIATAVQAQEATPTQQEEMPTEVPQPTEEPTPLPEPTEPEPTPTEVLPEEYEDTFDRNNKDWTDPLFVTTQASGRDPYTEIRIESGFMRFSVKDLETYVYKFLNNNVDRDVTIEIDYQSKSSLNNGIAVVCKANDELTKWYEIRFTSNNSFLNFYTYDKELKVNENKNPYVQIGKTHIKTDEIGPTKANHLEITCTDAEITVDINKGKRVVVQSLETVLDGTRVGLGAMSYDVLPVTIDFDTFLVTSAQ